MRKSINRIALIQSAKNEQDAARAGFLRLAAILIAIQRLTADTDVAVANLASQGATIADEFADEARANGEQYTHLLETEVRRHG